MDNFKRALDALDQSLVDHADKLTSMSDVNTSLHSLFTKFKAHEARNPKVTTCFDTLVARAHGHVLYANSLANILQSGWFTNHADDIERLHEDLVKLHEDIPAALQLDWLVGTVARLEEKIDRLLTPGTEE